MSWFQTTNFASLAKSALKEAQKTIDKALDIQNDDSSNTSSVPSSTTHTEDKIGKSSLSFPLFNRYNDTEEVEEEANKNIEVETKDEGSEDEEVVDKRDCESSMMSSIQEMSSSGFNDDDDDNDEDNESHKVQNEPSSSINTDSTTIMNNDESTKWSTIEIETVETSHSRNSSISTIPDSNTSPERVVDQQNPTPIGIGHVVYVNGQPMNNILVESSSSRSDDFSGDVITIKNSDDENQDINNCEQITLSDSVTQEQDAENYEKVVLVEETAANTTSNATAGSLVILEKNLREDNNSNTSSSTSFEHVELISSSIINSSTHDHLKDISISSNNESGITTRDNESEVMLINDNPTCDIKNNNSGESEIEMDMSTSALNDITILPISAASPGGTATTSNNNNTNSNNSVTKPVTKVKTNASSASSSDIEVIPLDSEEQLIAKILQEAETQTDDKYFEKKPVIPPPVIVQSSSNKANEEALAKLSAQMESKLHEKDIEIKELLHEGEKLSKKQFELSNVIKKLRSKEKETDKTIKGLKNELAEKSVEIERLLKVFVNKETVEQSQQDTISKLTAEKRKLESQVERFQSELEDATANCESMKVSMENTSLEILETKNMMQAVQREAAEVDRLTKEKSELLNKSETLQKQVDHLRTVINDTHKQASEREQELKTQLTTITAKYHRLENELSDVSSEIADATMPLSLEIEKLQTELKNSNLISTKRESALQSTISDLQLKLKQYTDRENSFTDMQQSYQTNLSALENQNDELENECKRLRTLLEQEKSSSTGKLQETIKKLEALTIDHDRLKRENESLENEIRLEQGEKKKYQNLLLEQQQRQQQQQQQIISSSASTTSSNIHSALAHRSSSDSNTNTPTATNVNQKLISSGNNSPSSHSILSEASYLDEVFDPNGQNARSMTPKSFFENLSFSSANVIENLHAQLRLREGELAQYQDEVIKNEKIRKTLNEEIAQLTVQNQEHLLQMDKITELQSRLEEVEKNYNAVLQMYGEKVEEAEELRLDLQDVKEMYKAQIEQLLKR